MRSNAVITPLVDIIASEKICDRLFYLSIFSVCDLSSVDIDIAKNPCFASALRALSKTD